MHHLNTMERGRTGPRSVPGQPPAFPNSDRLSQPLFVSTPPRDGMSRTGPPSLHCDSPTTQTVNRFSKMKISERENRINFSNQNFSAQPEGQESSSLQCRSQPITPGSGETQFTSLLNLARSESAEFDGMTSPVPTELMNSLSSDSIDRGPKNSPSRRSLSNPFPRDIAYSSTSPTAIYTMQSSGVAKKKALPVVGGRLQSSSYTSMPSVEVESPHLEIDQDDFGYSRSRRSPSDPRMQALTLSPPAPVPKQSLSKSQSFCFRDNLRGNADIFSAMNGSAYDRSRRASETNSNGGSRSNSSGESSENNSRNSSKASSNRGSFTQEGKEVLKSRRKRNIKLNLPEKPLTTIYSNGEMARAISFSSSSTFVDNYVDDRPKTARQLTQKSTSADSSKDFIRTKPMSSGSATRKVHAPPPLFNIAPPKRKCQKPSPRDHQSSASSSQANQDGQCDRNPERVRLTQSELMPVFDTDMDEMDIFSREHFSPTSHEETVFEEENSFDADCKRSLSQSVTIPRRASVMAPTTVTLAEYGVGSRTQTLLPNIRGRHSDLISINGNTLSDVLNGKWQEGYDHFVLIDCRYQFEYEGGHIRGAVNLQTKEELDEYLFKQQKYITKKTLVVLYCEFSSQRAPKQMRTLRQHDRHVNGLRAYPNLHFPEIYLLEGGYSKFWESFSDYCDPKAYIEMNDSKYKDRLIEARKRHNKHHKRRQYATNRKCSFNSAV